jgi:hypothetical protein
MQIKRRKNPPAFEQEGLVSLSCISGTSVQCWCWYLVLALHWRHLPALASPCGIGVGVATYYLVLPVGIGDMGVALALSHGYNIVRT